MKHHCPASCRAIRRCHPRRPTHNASHFSCPVATDVNCSWLFRSQMVNTYIHSGPSTFVKNTNVDSQDWTSTVLAFACCGQTALLMSSVRLSMKGRRITHLHGAETLKNFSFKLFVLCKQVSIYAIIRVSCSLRRFGIVKPKLHRWRTKCQLMNISGSTSQCHDFNLGIGTNFQAKYLYCQS